MHKKASVEDSVVRLHCVCLMGSVSWHGTRHRITELSARQPANAPCIQVVEVGAVVNCSAEIGDGSLIGSGSVVGSGVTIGPSSCIGHQVSLQNCVIGSHVAIHSGVKIGQDGEHSAVRQLQDASDVADDDVHQYRTVLMILFRDLLQQDLDFMLMKRAWL